MDSYFLSATLAKWTLENKFTIVSRMRQIRIGVPIELKTDMNRKKSYLLVLIMARRKLFLSLKSIRKLEEALLFIFFLHNTQRESKVDVGR